MDVISKFDKGFWYKLCVIYIYRKYTLLAPLKDQNGTTIPNYFQKHLYKSNRKPNKQNIGE